MKTLNKITYSRIFNDLNVKNSFCYILCVICFLLILGCNRDEEMVTSATSNSQQFIELDKLESGISELTSSDALKVAEIELAVVTGLEQRTQVYSRALIHFSSENLEDRRQISTSVDKFSNEFIKKPGKIAINKDKGYR